MTTEDDEFLKAYNQKRPSGPKLSEDDFEKLMEVYEEEALLQAPFASVDGTIIQFQALQSAVKQEINEKVQVFAKDVYEHWRNRRQQAGNNTLQPSLKAEKDQVRDDGDPYVCFRRRDGRITRKTRGRDLQSVDKLKKLRREIEEGRALIAMALQRELVKKDMLLADRTIFQMRAEVKRNKIKLGIKTDDEDLINQKVCQTVVVPSGNADSQAATEEKAANGVFFSNPTSTWASYTLTWTL
jgi:enhancer of polycomb-like protein